MHCNFIKGRDLLLLLPRVFCIIGGCSSSPSVLGVKQWSLALKNNYGSCGNQRREMFSNKLISHDEKTKEISTVKKIWICDLIIIKFGELLLWISLRTTNSCFERLYQTLERVIYQISKHFNFGFNNAAEPHFFTRILSIWICDETLFLLSDTVYCVKFND